MERGEEAGKAKGYFTQESQITTYPPVHTEDDSATLADDAMALVIAAPSSPTDSEAFMRIPTYACRIGRLTDFDAIQAVHTTGFSTIHGVYAIIEEVSPTRDAISIRPNGQGSPSLCRDTNEEAHYQRHRKDGQKGREHTDVTVTGESCSTAMEGV